MVETGIVLVSLVEGVPDVVVVPDGVESVVKGMVVGISSVKRSRENSIQ